MRNLTKEDLIRIHQYIERNFKTTSGILSQGKLDSIVLRPDIILYIKKYIQTYIQKPHHSWRQ